MKSRINRFIRGKAASPGLIPVNAEIRSYENGRTISGHSSLLANRDTSLIFQKFDNMLM
jgi:hypothetical protein